MNIFRMLKQDDGAAAVEFAIILPILFVLLFGIIEFGFYIYNQQMLTNAAREGARAGIVASIPRVPPSSTNPDIETIETVVQNYFNDYAITFGEQNDVVLDGTPDGYDDSDDPTDDDYPKSGDTLIIKVKYDYGFLVLPNFLGDWLEQLENMTATAAMRYE